MRERDCYSVSASKILALTPSCCSPDRSPPPLRQLDSILFSKGAEAPDSGATGGKSGRAREGGTRFTATAFPLFRCFCSVANIGTVSPTEEKRSLPEGADDSGHSCTIGSEIYLDVSYLHYLHDARRSIGSCLQACRVWSAPYDGKDPPPDKYHGGVLKEPVLKGHPPQGTARKIPQPLAQARPAKNGEPASGNPLELEWDDSYDACPVQTGDAGEETPAPSAEPPKHIQEMRKTATMLVKGSYIEENDFQDDVMVYDLVAKKDSRDSGPDKSNRSAPEGAQPGSAEAPPDAGGPAAPRDAVGSDSKARSQTGCNSNLQNGAASELRDDLLAQYEDLLRALDPGPGGKPVRDEGGSRKDATPAEEEEDDEEEEMDFSFIPETPDPEKLPFGRFFGGTAGRGQSVPFTGQSGVPAFPPRAPEPGAERPFVQVRSSACCCPAWRTC